MEVQVPGSISLEELLQGLEDAPVVETDDGYLDIEGWGKVWQVSETQTARAVTKLVKAGRMVMKKKLSHTITGALYWKPVYGVVDETHNQASDDVQS